MALQPKREALDGRIARRLLANFVDDPIDIRIMTWRQNHQRWKQTRQQQMEGNNYNDHH